MPTRTRDQTIAASTLLPLQSLLQQRGIDPEPWLAKHGLAADTIRNPQQRLPTEQLRRAWADALALSADPALAVHTARVVAPTAFGALGHVLAHARNLGQVLSLILRFHKLVADQPLLEIHGGHPGLVELRLPPDSQADPEASRPLVEFLLISLLRLANLLAAGEDLAPRYLRAVQFRHQRPRAAVRQAYQQVFGPAEIHYAAPHSALRFDAEALALAVAYRDPQLFQLLEQQAEAQLRALATENDPVERARAAIRRRLLGRTPQIQQVATDCATSRATLQRRLAEAGTSFRQLLEDERRSSACELLREGQSIDTIAHLLGYGDTAAFQHAFKRWMGVSAGTWRTQAPHSPNHQGQGSSDERHTRD